MMKRLSICLALAVVCMLAAAPCAKAEHVFYAFLDGSQENPPVETGASGFAVFVLEDDLTMLNFAVSYSALDGTSVNGAHFHMAPFGMNGGIIRGYNEGDFDINGGLFQNAWTDADAMPLTPARVQQLFDGLIYFNIHTLPDNPGGLIRGQVWYLFSY